MVILLCLCFSFQGYVIGNMISILSKTIYYIIYTFIYFLYMFLSHSIHNGFFHVSLFFGTSTYLNPQKATTAAFAGPRHPWQVIGTSSAVLLHLMRSAVILPMAQWIGFVGKIETGNPWVFYHQISGFPVNFPIIQFYDDEIGESWDFLSEKKTLNVSPKKTKRSD